MAKAKQEDTITNAWAHELIEAIAAANQDEARPLRKELIVGLMSVDCLPITQACAIAGITPHTYYQWIKDDQKFESAVVAAKAQAMQRLMKEARDHRGGAVFLLKHLFQQFADKPMDLNLNLNSVSGMRIVNEGDDDVDVEEDGSGDHDPEADSEADDSGE